MQSSMRRVRLPVVLAAVALAAYPAQANPPFINMLFPPPGMTGPHEDASAPHALPAYPAHARACQEGGTVKLELTIAADGSVSSARVTASSGFADLDAEAQLTARSWRYAAATKDGVPLAVRVATSLTFAPEKHGPDFQTDCTPAGTQAAAEALLHPSP
jgi:protein TonB